MSQVYTPTAVSHGSFTLPSDGDPAVAESVNDALRDLADNALVALTNAASALALALQAVNGTTGGEYSPAAPIEILTSGLNIDGGFGTDLRILTQSRLLVGSNIVLTPSGSISVEGIAVFAGTSFTVTTTALFTSTVEIDTLTAGNSTFVGNVDLGSSVTDIITVIGELVVTNPATFENTATFGSSVEIDNLLAGNSNFVGNVALGSSGTDTIELNAPLTYGTEGRVPYREPFLLPNSSATLDIGDGEVFVVRPGITATRAYALSSAGARHGDRIKFMTGNSTTMSNAANINSDIPTESAIFAAGNCWSAQYVQLQGLADRPDGWYLDYLVEVR